MYLVKYLINNVGLNVEEFEPIFSQLFLLSPEWWLSGDLEYCSIFWPSCLRAKLDNLVLVNKCY